MIDALAKRWDEVLPLLTPDEQRTLRGLVVDLAEARDEPTRVALSQRIALLLFEALPRDHPVVVTGNRLTVAPSHLRPSVGLFTYLRMRVAEQVPWPAADRILMADWDTPRSLRGRGIDPDFPQLIRLERTDGSVAVPLFQFADDGLPRATVLRINRLLDACEDPWGVADWWLSTNIWLHDAPVELLDGPEEANLLAAAHAAAGGAR
jgi:hypothetical protein